jgi:hypothetical protein
MDSDQAHDLADTLHGICVTGHVVSTWSGYLWRQTLTADMTPLHRIDEKLVRASSSGAPEQAWN